MSVAAACSSLGVASYLERCDGISVFLSRVHLRRGMVSARLQDGHSEMIFSVPSGMTGTKYKVKNFEAV